MRISRGAADSRAPNAIARRVAAIALAVVAVMLCCAAALGYRGSRSESRTASAGDATSRAASSSAPAFVVSTTSGAPFAAPTGKPTALLFLTTTGCADCATRAQALNALAQRSGPRLAALGIELDAGASKRDVESFGTALGLVYPLAFDDGATLQRRFGAAALSTVVVLDGVGRLVYRGIDPSADALDAALGRAGLR